MLLLPSFFPSCCIQKVQTLYHRFSLIHFTLVCVCVYVCILSHHVFVGLRQKKTKQKEKKTTRRRKQLLALINTVVISSGSQLIN